MWDSPNAIVPIPKLRCMKLGLALWLEWSIAPKRLVSQPGDEYMGYPGATGGDSVSMVWERRKHDHSAASVVGHLCENIARTCPNNDMDRNGTKVLIL